MRRHRPAALAAMLALAVPAPALAQSAGDDQYSDPFAGRDGQQEDSGSNPSEGDSQPAPPPADPAPAPTQSASPAPAQPGSEPVATTAAELPRTGSEAVWVAGLGVLLVAAGLRLRRTAAA